jgi:hypothetical protein
VPIQTAYCSHKEGSKTHGTSLGDAVVQCQTRKSQPCTRHRNPSQHAALVRLQCNAQGLHIAAPWCGHISNMLAPTGSMRVCQHPGRKVLGGALNSCKATATCTRGAQSTETLHTEQLTKHRVAHRTAVQPQHSMSGPSKNTACFERHDCQMSPQDTVNGYLGNNCKVLHTRPGMAVHLRP